MGYFYYGAAAYAIEIDDRPLAHFKIATLTLVRAGESFAFSFVRPASIGSGRETLWICPTTDIRFRFNGNRAPKINELWVRLIIESAVAPTGMVLVPEPEMAGENRLVSS